MKKQPALFSLVITLVLLTSLIFQVTSAYAVVWTWTPQVSGIMQNINSVTYATTQYVAVGDNGKILTSPDAETWTAQESGIMSTLNDVSGLTAVGSGGVIRSSADGVTWGAQTSGTSNSLNGIAGGVVVGGNGTILKFTGTWAMQTSGTTNSLNAIALGGTQYVVVGSGGTILTSPDGATWTTQTSGTTDDLESVAYGGSQFVAVGVVTILTSPDGVTWTAQTSGTTKILRGAVYGANKFVVVGNSGTILTSPDGITWTLDNSGTFNILNGVGFGDGQFVAVGNQGTITTYSTVVRPTITKIAPTSGPAAGGTDVVLTGTNLTDGTVTFGTYPATCTVDSATQISCKSPAQAAGKVAVTVSIPAGTKFSYKDGFTYIPAPTISAVLPNFGPEAGSTLVTITGTDFTGATSVQFGGAEVFSSCTGLTATFITCPTPLHAPGAVDVTLTTPGGMATLAGGFTYHPAPTITSIVPNGGPVAGGTDVVITGTNLLAGTVTFDLLSATCTVDSATQISCKSPDHTAGGEGPMDVVVTTSGGKATGGFTYYAPPTITSIAPKSGPVTGGTSVVITGTSLAGFTSVLFDQAAATCTAQSWTQITCATPAHVAGLVDVFVATPGGSYVKTAEYTYFPAVTSILPNSGSTEGGTVVVITGKELTGTTAVILGGSNCAIASATDTEVTCATTLHTAGAVDVVVTTTTGGTTYTATMPGAYTYVVFPIISGNAAGISGVTLTYTGTTSGTTLSGAGGAYTISVPVGWTGTVTPSKVGYADFYIPKSLPYTAVTTDQTKQNYGAQVTFRSTKLDGYVTESAAGSNKGGAFKANTKTFWVGDDALNRRYRGLLNFFTDSLPDVPVNVTSLVMKIKMEKAVGTNPFTYPAPATIAVDIKKGNFGAAGLEKTDFEAKATLAKAGSFGRKAASGWYQASFTAAGRKNVNMAGNTQFRLGFTVNKANGIADYVSFYTGLTKTAANKPYLIIKYMMP